MTLVLWGAHRGDTIYNTRAFWRRNLMVGQATITVDNPLIFDVGTMFDIPRTGETFTVGSIERDQIGIVKHD